VRLGAAVLRRFGEKGKNPNKIWCFDIENFRWVKKKLL
jgi:hypothetical protein